MACIQGLGLWAAIQYAQKSAGNNGQRKEEKGGPVILASDSSEVWSWARAGAVMAAKAATSSSARKTNIAKAQAVKRPDSYYVDGRWEKQREAAGRKTLTEVSGRDLSFY